MKDLDVAIIADDLTGALDASVGFAELGLSTRVFLSPSDVDADFTNVRVAAISTNSRDVPECEAVAFTNQACQAIAPYNPKIWIKKIDSRLKGNPAMEVMQVRLRSGLSTTIGLPAVPRLGRRVEQGQLVGHGVDTPVDVNRVLSSDLLPAGCSPVPDCSSEKDMKRLVKAALAETPMPLFVGASSMTRAIANLIADGKTAKGAACEDGPIWFAIGSRDPITKHQVAQLSAWAGDKMSIVAAPNGAVPSQAVAGDALFYCSKGKKVESEWTVGLRFSKSVTTAFLAARPSTLVLSGGTTAAHILKFLKISRLDPKEEVAPGIVVSSAQFDARPLRIITKSGGFGQNEVLADLLQNARTTRARVAVKDGG